MAKCSYCHQRKGKRACPALHAEICTGCCGERRGKEIHCPPDCAYLSTHEAYQRERIGELFTLTWHRFSKQSKAASGESGYRLGLFLLMTIFQYVVDRPAALDAEVLSGLEQLRKRMSPIHLPQFFSTPLGEFLWKKLEAFTREMPIDPSVASAVLEEYLKMLSDFSGGSATSNQANRGIVGFVRANFPEVVQVLQEQEAPPDRIVRV